MDPTKPANDDLDDEALRDDPGFEAFCERLWEVAVRASDKAYEGHRDQVPPPEQSVAEQLDLYREAWDARHQALALRDAAWHGEEMIRRAEQDLIEMRRALAALQQPRSELLRSRIGLAPSTCGN